MLQMFSLNHIVSAIGEKKKLFMGRHMLDRPLKEILEILNCCSQIVLLLIVIVIYQDMKILRGETRQNLTRDVSGLYERNLF